MSLSQSDGKERLQVNLDKNFDDFEEFCNTENISADMWAETFDAIAKNVIPTSTTASSAKSAMRAALSGLSVPATGLAVLVAAANTYATTLGSGMTGYVAVPPIFLPTDFGDPSLSAPSITGEQACDLMATKLVTKFLTGTAILTPPGTPTIPWS